MALYLLRNWLVLGNAVLDPKGVIFDLFQHLNVAMLVFLVRVLQQQYQQ